MTDIYDAVFRKPLWIPVDASAMWVHNCVFLGPHAREDWRVAYDYPMERPACCVVNLP